MNATTASRPLGIFSVSYAGLWGQARLGTADFVRRAAALGFDAVLLMAKRPHLSPLDAPSLLPEIEDAFGETGIKCIGLACYNDALLGGAAEIPAAEAQLISIDTSCAIAARLCAAHGLPGSPPIVRIFTGYSRPALGWRRDWDDCVAFLREAGTIAARHGVTLAVQNHHDLAVDSIEMDRLLAEVAMDRVRAGFDAWSPWLRGEDLGAAARRLAPRTVLSIAADYVHRPRWVYEPALVNYRRELPDAVTAVAMGAGGIDYPSFMDGLAAGGYHGPLVYEMCSPLEGGPSIENLDAKARAFLAYMRRAKDTP